MVRGMASQAAVRPRLLPGYAGELARVEIDIAGLESRRESLPGNLETRVRLAYRLFHRASLTGSMAHFEVVEETIRETIDEFGPKEDLCLLKANLAFRFHRLAEVRRDLGLSPLLAGRFEGRALLADLDFQEGRYDAARLELERLIAENRTWDNLARLAYLKGKLDDIAEADQLYEEAEDDLTVKQMRCYAWLELQRGVLAFTHGHYERARRHYQRADAAYPGYWHTEEHFAELMAAEGKFPEAAELFRKVVARSPKPELQQALGELYVLSGRPEEAHPWFASAQAAYLESVERGDVHYFHHLADFYADAGKEPAEAVRWAHKDLEIRSNFSTQAALAWVLYRNDQLSEALEYIRLALASGVRDAHIFSTAATLFEAVGDNDKSEHYAHAALQINPHHQNFHLHR